MQYCVNKPYPKVKVEKENLNYASLLLEDYCGNKSELTSINQYIYQHFDKFITNEELASALKEISLVEMRHLELLGETIRLLGLHPQFKYLENDTLCSWSSDTIDYTINLIDMLKSDILLEKEAIKNYTYHLSIIDDIYIKQLLKRILEDEYLHLDVFNYLLAKLLN